MDPRIDDANPNTLPAMLFANLETAELASVSWVWRAPTDTSTPNHLLVKLLRDCRMPGAASISFWIWLTRTGTIRATMTTVKTPSPKMMTPVASPRRQPRWASQSTAGSRANEANNEMKTQISRSRICLKNA